MSTMGYNLEYNGKDHGSVWKYPHDRNRKPCIAKSEIVRIVLEWVEQMKIAVITFRLRASWVHSLKEKRMIVKSLIAKLQNKYHVSAAEVDEQDTHQIIVIGVAAIVPHNAMADSLMDDISLFVEENTEVEIIDEEREVRWLR